MSGAPSPAQLERIALAPRPAPAPEPQLEQVLREIRYARARLAVADAELNWVDWMVQHRNITARAALEQLDLTMSEFEASL